MDTDLDKELVLDIHPYETVRIFGVPLIYIYKKDHHGPS